MEVVVVKPLKPFLTYFGGKWRVAPYYPEPQYSTIIEPFAGAAGYSMHYWNRQIILNDLDPEIASMWQWLISADPLEVMSIPTKIWSLDEAPDLIPEARLLLSRWLQSGWPTGTKNKSSKAIKMPSGVWSDAIRLRIASQLKYIRHWQVTSLSYDELDNQEATWFIDPPYQVAGRAYRCSSDKIDFNHLAQWCQSRYGQVMVCENEGADWLPFEEFGQFAGLKCGGATTEVLYTQHHKAPSVVSIE